jgi:hypothetical protein
MVAATNSASSRSVSPSKEMIDSPSCSSVNRRFSRRSVLRAMMRVGRAQDAAGRSVVLLQLDHARAGVVALEVEDVADVGAAPLVDRLILVADHGDAVRALGEEAHQAVLHAVGVLELVDQHVVEAPRQLGRRRALAGAQAQGGEQETPEVGGVGGGEPPLVGGVGLGHHVVEVVARGIGPGGDALVLGAIDGGQHLAHRKQALGHLEIGQHADMQALLIVVVVDDEVAAQPHRLAQAPQQARAQGVEGADPQARPCSGRECPAAWPPARAARRPPCW